MSLFHCACVGEEPAEDNDTSDETKADDMENKASMYLELNTYCLWHHLVNSDAVTDESVCCLTQANAC